MQDQDSQECLLLAGNELDCSPAFQNFERAEDPKKVPAGATPSDASTRASRLLEPDFAAIYLRLASEQPLRVHGRNELADG